METIKIRVPTQEEADRLNTIHLQKCALAISYADAVDALILGRKSGEILDTDFRVRVAPSEEILLEIKEEIEKICRQMELLQDKLNTLTRFCRRWE